MIEIREELPTAETIATYREIPMAFLVKSRYEAQPKSAGRWDLQEVAVDPPFTKDYDEAESPHEWASVFDLSNWIILSAFDAERRVGGALLAFNTRGIDMLEGRSDLTVIWDIRVAPEFRRHGIGSALFENAVQWARKSGCLELKVETQNINAAACNFYARMGCELRAVREGAYPTLPNEIQFLWYREV